MVTPFSSWSVCWSVCIACQFSRCYKEFRTDNLSPQFHVVYDNFFETVHSGDDDKEPAGWENLVTFSRDQVFLDDDDPVAVPELADEWVDEATLETRRRQRMERRDTTPPAAPESGAKPQIREPASRAATETAPTTPVADPDPAPMVNPPTPTTPDRVDGTSTPSPGPRRGKRVRFAAERYTPGQSGFEHNPEPGRMMQLNKRIAEKATMRSLGLYTSGRGSFERTRSMMMSVAKIVASSSLGKRDYSLVYALLTDPEFGIVEAMIPHVGTQCTEMLHSELWKSSKKNDPDHPKWGEAMRGPYRDEFLLAMGKEIEELEQHSTWELVKRSSLPEGAHVLASTWVFRIKRYPDGRFRKTKARFCVRGDMQEEGVDYFDRYAPVVAWSTVRLLLCLSISNDWVTKQVDFSNAFVQAELKEDVYVTLPAMFDGPNGETGKEVCMKLNRSLYGLVQAPLYWYNHLKAALEDPAIGFKASDLDPCMFYGHGMVILIYVDDCLFFGPDMKKVNEIIDKLKKVKKPALTVGDDDAYAFLGVDVSPNGKGGYTMTQKGLIKEV